MVVLQKDFTVCIGKKACESLGLVPGVDLDVNVTFLIEKNCNGIILSPVIEVDE